jgi:DNA-binding transcriptional regulator YbjK
VTDRRTVLLDAALDVVGQQGLRALTHRAVDAAAGVPAGSASNLFRSRAELVAALLDRLLEREVALWQEMAGPAQDPPPARARALSGTAELLAGTVAGLLGPARGLVLARQALFHEAAFEPGLQHRVTAARARLTALAREWLVRLGLHVDDDGVSLLLATVNGMLANQIAGPEPGFDPAKSLRVVLDAVAAPEEER